MFRLGYNTNGLAHHRPVDALRLAHELGYEALALTPDPGCLDPFDLRENELPDLRRWAEDLGLELVLETGSRYLLDAGRKHFPTLLEESAADRARRLDFLQRCADMAASLDAGVVSIWSGAAPRGAVADWPRAQALDPATASAREQAWDHLCEGVVTLLEFMDGTSVNLALEPEPGMFLATTAGYAELCSRLGSASDALGLTLDVGHCLVTNDNVEATIREWAPRIVNVHLDDIKDGIHDHRMFGEGTLDLRTTLHTLIDVGFADIASVELSRDSHRGPVAAAQAMAHIKTALT